MSSKNDSPYDAIPNMEHGESLDPTHEAELNDTYRETGSAPFVHSSKSSFDKYDGGTKKSD